MSAEILINTTPMETRVALIEQGMLQEIYIERRSKRGPVGNIIMGKVVRVMPGMEAAFVDIGLERAGFIHAADITLIDNDGFELESPKSATISQLVREGQMLLVQVLKEPIAKKGARLTTHLSLVSRYLVYMPRSRHLGVSLRIEDDSERERLLSALENCVEQEQLKDQAGYILRTAAEGVNESELLTDMQFLHKVWGSVKRKAEGCRKVGVIYQDLVLYVRAMRDLIRPQVKRIQIDGQQSFAEALQFTQEFIPELVDCIELYEEEQPLFDLYGIDDEIQRALSKTVKLKSGGNLVIDQNEAMTTIDVNTGAFLGTRNQAETILKTNLEAAKASVRQIKIRNLGGIIILDFIDMEDEGHQRQVLRTLSAALEQDPARTHISEMSALGLVEMTRKRSRESLEQILCDECPSCNGRGTIKTPETVCFEVFREIMRTARVFDNESLLVMVSQEVIDRLLDEDSATVADLEVLLGKKIGFQVESMYTTEQFDVVLS